jgi:hypothetical protein
VTHCSQADMYRRFGETWFVLNQVRRINRGVGGWEEIACQRVSGKNWGAKICLKATLFHWPHRSPVFSILVPLFSCSFYSFTSKIGNSFLRNVCTFWQDARRQILEILSVEQNRWFNEFTCPTELTVLPSRGWGHPTRWSPRAELDCHMGIPSALVKENCWRAWYRK